MSKMYYVVRRTVYTDTNVNRKTWVHETMESALSQVLMLVRAHNDCRWQYDEAGHECLVSLMGVGNSAVVDIGIETASDKYLHGES